MDTSTLLLEQLQQAHNLLEQSVEGVTREQAARLPPGDGYPIGAVYASVLILEDATVNALLRGGRPLFSAEWDNRVGVSDCMPLPGGLWQDFSGPGWEEFDGWARSVQIGWLGLQRYAQAVYEASYKYLSQLRTDDLDRTLDLSALGQGYLSVASILSKLVIGRVYSACGEIDCLKRLYSV